MISRAENFLSFLRGKFSPTKGIIPLKMLIIVSIMLLHVLFLTGRLYALTPVVIDENTESVSLGRYMDILEDPTGELTIDDVTKPEMQGRWFQSKWDVPNFGFTDKTYWFRYKLLRQNLIDLNFYFQLKWPHVNEIETYETVGNQIVSNYKTGDFLLFSERPVKSRNFNFPMVCNQQVSVIYVKIKSDDSLQLPFLLLRDDIFFQKQNQDMLFHGISFGFLIVLLMYNLFIFFSIRDINYLYYNVFVFTQIDFQMAFFGFGYQYLWRTNPYIQRIAVAVTSIFALISTIIFNCSFLRIKKLSSFLYSALKINSFLLISGLFLAFINYIKFSFIVLNISGCMAAIVLILASVKALRIGRPEVKFFITAWILMISATLIFMLKNSGFFYFYGVDYLFLTGVLCAQLCFSFALADRINIMKREKEEAQDEALRIQKEATDTLELKVTERTTELAEANEKLRELDRAKTDFFANISHELRTPLTLILAPVEEALSGRELDKDTLRMIKRNSLDLLSLINDLLEVSRITAGRIRLAVSEIDLSEMVKQFCGGMESSAKLKGIELSCTCSGPVKTFADRERLTHVISNFFSNSFKFTEPGGKIEVKIRSDETHAIIEFRDTGCGIPANKLDTIFDRFTQADTSSTRRHEGTGIGLSIVKELVELHGGEVSAESRYIEDDPENHGTIFIVKIPLGREHFAGRSDIVITGEYVAGSEETGISIPHIRGLDAHPELKEGKVLSVQDEFDSERPSILIVEDNRDLRVLLVNMLSGNYIVYDAPDGNEAVKILESTDEIDLVLSDIMMPGMDGHELLKWIRGEERFEGLPVLLLTARADHFMKIEGLDLGATDYVTKPFNSDELLLRIKNHMELKLLRNKALRNYNSLLEKIKGVKPKSLSDENTAKIEAVCEFIKDHYLEELNRDLLAEAAGVTPDTFSRLFNQYTGKSLNEFIYELRIAEAMKKLSETEETVTRIAIDTGFDSIRTFNRAFRKIAGITPGEFRERGVLQN